VFDLKRPCVTCPFRKGQGERFQLPRSRLTEIMNAQAFQCHKTVEYHDDYDDDGEEQHSQGDKPQQCAGLMAVLHRAGMPNQMMRIAERLGSLDPDQLDPRGEAYESVGEVLAAHKGARFK
jgi:hypothetical protein